jgi:uncharacterized protein YjdB
MNYVKFIPNTKPIGGYYRIKITLHEEETLSSEEFLFAGEGSLNNPFLASKALDIVGLISDETYAYSYINQICDISSTLTNPITINNDRKVSFGGVYNGFNYNLSFGGNGGLFHEITSNGIVKNINIPSGSVNITASESNTYPIGGIADINYGLIDNVNSRVLINDPHFQGTLEVFTSIDTDGLYGAGSIVGVNKASGIISNVNVSGSGAVKAGKGIGGVAAWNYGLITNANVSATLPAGNNANSGNASNSYSIAGGVVGYNFGTIKSSSVSGRVFMQSAYASSGNILKAVGVGGIAGYNDASGIIDECSFSRASTSKEYISKDKAESLGDSRNNLGVASIHGDAYVGGISGINAGTISNSYVGGALIAARDYVGGISGLTFVGSNITNSYVFATICIKDENGLKVTQASSLTTLSVYEIAPSNFNSSTTFYRPLLNSVTSLTWEPGDNEFPMIPLFDSNDLLVVGDKFNSSGLLAHQSNVVTGVNIILDNVMLGIGDVVGIDYTINPESAPDTYTTWTSSNASVVEIVGPGNIKGISAGSATVTVTTRDGGFTDTILVTVEDYIHANSVIVNASNIILPEANNQSDRPEIEVDTTITFSAIFDPIDAEFQGFSLSSSNSRAVVSNKDVTFVLGSGFGNVSITVTFEDSSLPSLEYRFKTIASSVPPVGVEISEVIVSADTISLPSVNLSSDRIDIEVGTIFTLEIEILPLNATNKNYTISISNSRASVSDKTVTVLNSGNFSVRILFEDTSVGIGGLLEYRFNGVIPIPPVTDASALVLSDFGSWPEANNSVRVTLLYTDVITLTITFEGTSNEGYTITVTNGRLIVTGNVITIRNSGAGNVSLTIDFSDPLIPDVTYNFVTAEA